MDSCLPIALSAASPFQPLVHIFSFVWVLIIRILDEELLKLVSYLRIPVIIFRTFVARVEEVADNARGLVHVNTWSKILETLITKGSS